LEFDSQNFQEEKEKIFDYFNRNNFPFVHSEKIIIKKNIFIKFLRDNFLLWLFLVL